MMKEDCIVTSLCRWQGNEEPLIGGLGSSRLYCPVHSVTICFTCSGVLYVQHQIIYQCLLLASSVTESWSNLCAHSMALLFLLDSGLQSSFQRHLAAVFGQSSSELDWYFGKGFSYSTVSLTESLGVAKKDWIPQNLALKCNLRQNCSCY